MYKIIATACPVILASVTVVRAETVPLNVELSTQLQMEIPPEFCLVRPTRGEIDKELIQFAERSYQGAAKLLAYFMDCDTYVALGTPDRSPKVWILVMAPIYQGAPVRTGGVSRGELFDQIDRANAGTASTSRRNADLARIGREFGLDLSVEQRPLGVLDRDSNGIYEGVLTRATVNGSTGIVAGVVTTTTVSGYVINLSIYSPFDSPNAFDESVDLIKEITQDFIEANEPRRR